MTPDDATLMAPPERPGHEYVFEMLSALWPEPATVRRVRAGARPPGQRVAQFVALPSPARPKALVPRSPRAATATAMKQLAGGSGRRAQLLSAGMGLLAAAGLMRVFPGGFVISVPPDAVRNDIGCYLALELAQPVTVSLKIGPVRAVQKPVLHLISPDGETVGFAKIGTTPFTASLVQTEAAALLLLGRATWQHLRVPEVLHHGQWNGHEVLVQQPLRGRPWAGERPDLQAAMVEVARSQGVTSRPLRASPWWTDVRSRIDRLPSSPVVHALREATAFVTTSRGGEELIFGSWHTDWAPWNIAMEDSRVLAWDWEQFQTDVPLGLDAIHFEIQRHVVGLAVAPRDAYAQVSRAAPGLLAAFGVPAEQSVLTVALYLLESASRYVRDGESGTRLSRVDLWLRQTLTDVTSALERERREVSVGRAGGHD